MTTTTWNTNAVVSDTATFRTAGTEINTALAALGCIQTADTGQINWTTVTYPAQNADGGYEVWRFNDALQGTAPVFFKITYGHHNNGSPAYIRLNVQVGTGSNGSGTLTGITSSLTSATRVASPSAGNFSSYGCMVNGTLNLALKIGSGGDGWMSIMRTQDSAGADTATGCMIIMRHPNASSAMYVTTLNFATATKVQDNVQAYNCFRLGNLSSSVVAGDNQAYLLWGAYPQALNHIGVCGFIEGEITHAATFTSALIGATSRTYLALVSQDSYIGTGLRPAMMYE